MSEDPTPPSAIPKRQAVAAVIGVTAVQVVVTMALMLPASIAPELARVFDVPVQWIGLQVSWAYIGAICMSVMTGLMVRKYGAIRTNQVAAGLLFVSLLLMVLPNLGTFLIGSFGLGLAQGLTNPAASHVMFKVASPQNRNLIFSMKQTGQPLGAVAAGLIGPPLTVTIGWQAAIACGAVFAFIVLIAIQPSRALFDSDRDPNTRFRGAAFRDTAMVLRDRKLRLLGLAGAAMTGVQIALMAFAVTMLVNDVHLDLVTAGTGLAVLQVAGAFGRVGWGAVADRVKSGLGTLVLVQMVAIAGAFATASLFPGVPILLVYGALAIYGASAIGWNGVFLAEAARLAPRGKVSSATGGIMIPVFIGAAIGPTLVSQLQGSIDDYATAFIILSGASFLAAVAAGVLWLGDRRSSGDN